MQEQPFWHFENQATYPILRGRRNADAVVVGGGLSGIHTALWLCKAGLRVILLEANTLASGASGRSAGLVSQTHGLLYSQMEQLFGYEVSQAYTQTQNAALQSLRDLAAEQGMDSGWRDMDAFVVSTQAEDDALLQKEHQAMNRSGLAATLTQATQCPIPSFSAIQFHGQALIHPYNHLLSVARKAIQLGLSIYENSRVTSLESNLVYTQRGSVLAPYLVIATGYPVINTPGWYFTRLYQRQSHLLPIESDAAYDGMYLDAHGRFAIRRHREGSIFHQIDGRVGTRIREQPLARFAQEYGPAFGHATPTDAYGGIDTYSADGLPYIGPYSKKTPNIFVATGYAHHGIVHSMLAAQIISAKILGLPGDGYPIYSGQRNSPAIHRAELKAGSSLAWRYLQSLARIHAPRCSHMGCKLVYRSKTKSWECPCHGSRFDDIGRVISAPAVFDAPVKHKRKG